MIDEEWIDERLAAIRERTKAASPGPWRHTEWDSAPAVFFGEAPTEAVAYRVEGVNDAEFIAHAREDIPFLLGEIKRLRDDRDDEMYARMEMLED